MKKTLWKGALLAVILAFLAVEPSLAAERVTKRSLIGALRALILKEGPSLPPFGVTTPKTILNGGSAEERGTAKQRA